MRYSDYVAFTIKIPQELKDKIDRLARQKGVTRNGWIVRSLVVMSKWKPGKP